MMCHLEKVTAWGNLQLEFVHLCILYRTVWSSNLLCMRNIQNKKSHRCQYSRAQPCNNVITSDTLPLWLQHTLYIYSIAKRPEPCCSVKELNPCLMENRKQWQYVGGKEDIIIRLSNQKGSSSCKRFLVLVTISLYIILHKGVHQENFSLHFFKRQRFFKYLFTKHIKEIPTNHQPLSHNTQIHSLKLKESPPPVALQPNAGYGLLILEVSRSHTMTHHSR